MKKISLVIVGILVVVFLLFGQTINLSNGWIAGTVVPTSCSSGVSPNFYNMASGLVHTCTNNVYTLGSSVVSNNDYVGQNVSIAATNFYTTSSNQSGLYKISCYTVVTQAATTSSTLPSCQYSWTDKDTGVVEPFSILTSANSANTIGATGAGSVFDTETISAAASSNIRVQATGYASSGATPMLYALHVKIEYLGR